LLDKRPIARVGREHQTVDLPAFLFFEGRQELQADLASVKSCLVAFPAEGPIPVQLHLVVFLDDGTAPVGQQSRLSRSWNKAYLKAARRSAVVAVAHPDVI